jgi:hypothetical protein
MRLDDWEARLGAFLTEARAREFQWGEHDCALFATGATAAMTDEDRAARFRGQYRDRKGSAAALRRLGKGTLIRTLDDLFERKKPAFARRGDLVWFHGSVGVCLGGEAAFVSEARLIRQAGVRGAGNLAMVPRRLWAKAWAA